jgi:hypothetical protein
MAGLGARRVAALVAVMAEPDSDGALQRFVIVLRRALVQRISEIGGA